MPGVVATRSSDAREASTAVEGKPEIEHLPAIEDFRSVMVQRAVFQSIASMGLPAFTIHSIVRYSGKALKDAKNKTIRTYGPIGVSHADDNHVINFSDQMREIAWFGGRPVSAIHVR